MFDLISTKLKDEIVKWDDYWLYLPERVILMKSILIGKIVFYLYTTIFNKSHFRQLENILFKFFWKSNVETKPRTLIKNKKNEGGWNVFDLSTFAESVQLSLIINTLKYGTHPLGNLLAYFIGDIAYKIKGMNIGNHHGKVVSYVKKCKERLTTLDNIIVQHNKIKPREIYYEIYQYCSLNNYKNFNWKRIYDTSLPPDCIETNWRFAVGALATKDLLLKMKRITHNKCTFCNSEDL